MRFLQRTLLGRSPSSAEKAVAFVVAAAFLACVTVVNAMTSPLVRVDAFLLVPVLVSTWFLGLGAGMFFAALTSASWWAVQLFAPGYPATTFGLASWNALMLMSMMGTAAYLLSRARREGFDLRILIDRIPWLPQVIPVCAWCRKLKDVGDEWQTLEQFLSNEAEILITHGVCPECAARLKEEAKARVRELAEREDLGR